MSKDRKEVHDAKLEGEMQDRWDDAISNGIANPASPELIAWLEEGIPMPGDEPDEDEDED